MSLYQSIIASIVLLILIYITVGDTRIRAGKFMWILSSIAAIAFSYMISRV